MLVVGNISINKHPISNILFLRVLVVKSVNVYVLVVGNISINKHPISNILFLRVLVVKSVNRCLVCSDIYYRMYVTSSRRCLQVMRTVLS